MALWKWVILGVFLSVVILGVIFRKDISWGFVGRWFKKLPREIFLTGIAILLGIFLGIGNLFQSFGKIQIKEPIKEFFGNCFSWIVEKVSDCFFSVADWATENWHLVKIGALFLLVIVVGGWLGVTGESFRIPNIPLPVSMQAKDIEYTIPARTADSHITLIGEDGVERFVPKSVLNEKDAVERSNITLISNEPDRTPVYAYDKGIDP